MGIPKPNSGYLLQSAITTQNPTIVKLLLRARMRVLKCLLSECLPIAIEQRQTEGVSLLVRYGANVNDKRALALRKRVQSQRSDLLLAIMKGKPTSEFVSWVFEDAFPPNSSITVEEKCLLLDILICGGVNDDPVAEVLIGVVRAGNAALPNVL